MKKIVTVCKHLLIVLIAVTTVSSAAGKGLAFAMPVEEAKKVRKLATTNSAAAQAACGYSRSEDFPSPSILFANARSKPDSARPGSSPGT